MEINDVFIYIDNNNIERSKCEEIIKRFDNDERKLPGTMTRGTDPTHKNTQDLFLANLEEWKDVDELLYNKLNASINEYLKTDIITSNNETLKIGRFSFDNVIDYGYNIQKYNANEGFYNWHSDFMAKIPINYQIRLIAFIWYLNDVAEGGETEFINGKVKPTAGKLMIFPSSWNYFHKGNMPLSNDKYIITGWAGYQ